MRHDHRVRILMVLLFLAVAETASTQTTDISTRLASRQPSRLMRGPISRPAASAAAASAPAQTTEAVLHNFSSPPHGVYPLAGVIRDPAGNIYGTANNGGASNWGVVFRVDTWGHETVLYSFTGGTDGGNPWGGVIGDAAGNLYGTTIYGGTSGAGVVFKVDKTGHETVLYNFTGGADGGYPYASVILDNAGNLYGTTSGGGASGAGVVFEADTTGHETVLYSFTGGTDGGSPNASLIRDSAGNLYGTTVYGGASGAGVVFKVAPAGETVLYSFTGGSDGGYPYWGVIRDAAGNLYGTTSGGGAAGNGAVFKLNTSGHETVLYSFTGGADGSYPNNVIRDSAGTLYGTTIYGGASGVGVVFKLDATDGETVLYNFKGLTDGAYPNAGVFRDAAGNLYGTTEWGGAGGAGVVYKLDVSGEQTALYGFPGAADGNSPWAGVIRDSDGNLYGTTSVGGASGAGIVYKVDTGGHRRVLYGFTGGTDGFQPLAGVIRDSAGNLYGTTYGGGIAPGWAGAGVVYKVDTAGVETVLHTFTGGADGGYPYAGLIRDSAGNLYGTTSGGGTAGSGVVFKLDPEGQETVLYSFTGGTDGGDPVVGVTRDPAGNLYGTTRLGGASGWGVVFEVNTAGQEMVLYSFTGGADGGRPWAVPVRDSAGNLYGTTLHGGASGAGVVFKVDTAGQETVLYNFCSLANCADGLGPSAAVIRDPAGNLYGTTEIGGASGAGVVFQLNTAGQETVLYSFTGGADGGQPFAGVVRDAAGNLYGTTYGGGEENSGVVFKIKPQ